MEKIKNEFINDDCFAYSKIDGCAALSTRNCKNCTFYKTMDKYLEDIQKAKKRIDKMRYL